MNSFSDISVTDATGYIGGLLSLRLVGRGRWVRAMSRSLERAMRQPRFDDVEVHVGDVLLPETLVRALEGAAGRPPPLPSASPPHAYHSIVAGRH